MESKFEIPAMREFVEGIFCAAFLKADEEMGEGLLKELQGERIRLSEFEEKRLRRLIARTLTRIRLKRARSIAIAVSRRVAVIIAAILLVGITLMATVKAVRDKVVELLFHFTEEYVEAEMEPAETDALPEELSDYVLGYLPEGFKLESSALDDHKNVFFYQNGEGQYIRYVIYFDKGVSNFDTEQADRTEELTIAGNKALLFEKEKLITLIWAQDQYYFVLGANISEEEIVRMAESVQKES